MFIDRFIALIFLCQSYLFSLILDPVSQSYCALTTRDEGIIEYMHHIAVTDTPNKYKLNSLLKVTFKGIASCCQSFSANLTERPFVVMVHEKLCESLEKFPSWYSNQ